MASVSCFPSYLKKSQSYQDEPLGCLCWCVGGVIDFVFLEKNKYLVVSVRIYERREEESRMQVCTCEVEVSIMDTSYFCCA